MKISDFYKNQNHTFSFEFFPPKNEAGEAALEGAIHKLKDLNPSFVSVTYGAMGTTRDNTLKIVSKIKNEIGIEAASHLTCVAHTPQEIEELLGMLQENNIENIVALRGDRPQDAQNSLGSEQLKHGSDLVKLIRQHPDYKDKFSLAVAGYPECHMECRDKVKDLEHLKMKVDAGADVIITQLFFMNESFFDFTERARKAGISIPIIPGIMPVTNGNQIQKFSAMCGTIIPEEMRKKIESLGEDTEEVTAYGIDFATKQCQELLDAGTPGIHFYTLNKSHATRSIYQNLSLTV